MSGFLRGKIINQCKRVMPPEAPSPAGPERLEDGETARWQAKAGEPLKNRAPRP